MWITWRFRIKLKYYGTKSYWFNLDIQHMNMECEKILADDLEMVKDERVTKDNPILRKRKVIG